MTVRPADDDERADATRLLFASLGPWAAAEKAAGVERLVRSGELPGDAIWVVRDACGLAGALIAAPVPGGGAAVWPPVTRPSHPHPTEVEDRLLTAALSSLRNKRIRLAQTLLGPEEADAGRSLERAGFRCITTLLIDRHYLDLAATAYADLIDLDLRTYDAVPPGVVESILVRTYVDSLDCPELNGCRSPADVLAGHRGSGPFDPRKWWVAFLDGEPVGMALCNRIERDAWEVAYLGVAPEARRRGVGRALITHALLEAKAAGMALAQITIDARNTPARRLYRQAGFIPHDEKQVWLWLADAVSPSAPE
jgi:ribosomal protein S18 acetylase RimI-like enzyme